MSVTILEPGSNLLVRGLATRVDVTAIGESVRDAILATVFPDRVQDDTFVASLGRCSRENVAGVVEVLAGRSALRDVDGHCAREFAGLVARLGIPLSELERSYWVGVERLWQDWFDLCRMTSSEGKAELPDLLGGSTSLLFGYVDRVLTQVVDRYALVAEEMSATCEDRRREVVLKLLDGSVTEAGEAVDALLGYRMRATHVGLLFTSENSKDVARTLAALREASKAPVSLLVQPDAGTWFGWLGYHDGVDNRRLEKLRLAATEIGEPVAIGEPGRGLAGFRRSHETARRTSDLRTTLRRPDTCLCARDLRLETFLLENTESARRFITDELGGLAADTDRAQRIRDTLLTWLSVGSQAKAAVELGVHENTVRMRVRCAAEELGAALADRRTELLVALRLCEALGP
ncbi:PucR family transcriptional regulator [Pseudonocardia spinosispora]|uniref:PucR family transcriptional regulator n=1 Tax=Pseudonocardia spinosispora TaxID=103441 RepID=UPI0003FE30A1|nr:helix-turn-helix domain-containing protein [Pseudonocardia spinosispora]